MSKNDLRHTDIGMEPEFEIACQTSKIVEKYYIFR